MSRLFLSPPHMGSEERELLLEAFDSNWIAPLGPHVDAFENEFCECVGSDYATALSSGTAGLHLAVKLSGVQAGDEVYCSTLNFAASVNPVLYEGAQPVFIDSESDSWNMDPVLLAEELESAAHRGRLPKAVILTHLYGQSADLDPILEVCGQFEVCLIEDAAESLGSTYGDRHPGTFGRFGVYSFNGNKIITCSGGGMLVSDNQVLVERARHLATQAKDPAPHYEHTKVGYNYRLSNLLAAIGRGQLRLLQDRVAARRKNFDYYHNALKSCDGISFMPEAAYGTCTRWLSTILLDAKSFGADREQVRKHLDELGIEARPVWKPMHLQPVFRSFRAAGGRVAEKLFIEGLCLPSGSQMTENDLQRVVDGILSTPQTGV